MATGRDVEESHEAAEPTTDEVHGDSRSTNIEKPRHTDDQELVVAQAIDAIEHTTAGDHVDLVTYGEQGHPSEYLLDAVEAGVDADVTVSYVDQCGCGGHVTRVHVE